MKPTAQQKRAYLKAIGFEGSPNISIATLKKIVEKHIFTFPFETLSLHDNKSDHAQKKPLSTDMYAMFNRMVVYKRGGHCVALNMLLQTMLTSFGFEVTPIAPDTMWQSPDIPKEKRLKHCAAIVKVKDQEFLVDAGFGGVGLLSTMPLVEGELTQFSEKFRLTATQDYPFELQLWEVDEWKAIYGFSNEIAKDKVYQEIDVIQSNPLHADCYFKTLLLCTKPFKIDDTHNGRYSICNEKFIIYENDDLKIQKAITSQRMLQRLLKEYFGIDVKGHTLRFEEKELEAYQVRAEKPSLLHSYPTRNKHKNTSLALLEQFKPRAAQRRKRVKMGTS